MSEFEAERKWAEKQFLSKLRDEFAKATITGILAGIVTGKQIGRAHV